MANRRHRAPGLSLPAGVVSCVKDYRSVPSLLRAIFRFSNAFLLLLMTIGIPPAASAAAHAAHKKVYLLRGLTNVLSPGIDQLNEELQRRNIDVTIANHAFADALAREAIEDCKNGRISSIVLVGHSLGASAAVSMAEQLRQAGLHVALIVTIDPVTKTVVPDNVRLLKNFYLSSGVGTTVEHDGHFHGTLQNVDMGKTGYGHVSLTAAPAIQSQAMRDILAANSSCR
jgi:pimeloyl-ACP methyl ester carboxylesterase